MRDGSPRVLRAMNERAALYALLTSGPLSRIELERAIGLSKPAAAELLSRLERDGLVVRSGHRAAGGPGPQAQLWSVNAQAGYAVGVDVTATTMDVAVADLTGAVGATRRVDSPGGSDDDPLGRLRTTVTATLRAAGVRWSDVRHLVVGIPGSVDPASGRLEYAPHLPGWSGFDVVSRLRSRLRVPVTVENDVNLVAVEELAQGGDVAPPSAVLLWMDRGVAAAVVLRGRLVRGSRGGAGEIDRVPVSTGDGVRIVRDLVSASAVCRAAAGNNLPADDADTAVRAAMEDPASAGFRDELVERIVAVLAMSVAALDPELVILAGGIGYAGGDRMADLVSDRLCVVLKQRPRVRAGAGGTAAVRQGALHAALRQAREAVLGRGAPDTDPHPLITVDSPERKVSQ